MSLICAWLAASDYVGFAQCKVWEDILFFDAAELDVVMCVFSFLCLFIFYLTTIQRSCSKNNSALLQ